MDFKTFLNHVSGDRGDELLSALVRCIAGEQLFVVIRGGPGSGKTALCTLLSSLLPGAFRRSHDGAGVLLIDAPPEPWRGSRPFTETGPAVFVTPSALPFDGALVFEAKGRLEEFRWPELLASGEAFLRALPFLVEGNLVTELANPAGYSLKWEVLADVAEQKLGPVYLQGVEGVLGVCGVERSRTFMPADGSSPARVVGVAAIFGPGALMLIAASASAHNRLYFVLEGTMTGRDGQNVLGVKDTRVLVARGRECGSGGWLRLVGVA